MAKLKEPCSLALCPIQEGCSNLLYYYLPEENPSFCTPDFTSAASVFVGLKQWYGYVIVLIPVTESAAILLELNRNSVALAATI